MLSPLLSNIRLNDLDRELEQRGHRFVNDLDENRDELIGLTNAWRTLQEMQIARESVEENLGSIIMLDNGLLPWLSVSGPAAQRHLQEYLVDYCAIRPGLVAGVISGPQSRLLERLVHLVEAETLEDGLEDRREFLDLSLMLHVLKPGERSALFKHGSPRNDRFAAQQGGVYFFFLHTQRAEIARIEIPEWVARDAQKVEQVHSSVLADAIVGGYSYVLSQAHQQVAVDWNLADTLRSCAITHYVQASGRLALSSAKAGMKQA